MNKKFEDIEQYDYLDDEILQKNIETISILIGKFLIEYSYLEHEVNIAIAEYINRRAHDPGYLFLEKFSMRNKIELFYSCYLQLNHYAENDQKAELKSVKSNLEILNTFRNYIAHANWQTLDSDFYVRTKIITDSENGMVKSVKTELSPKLIRINTKLIQKTINLMDEFREGLII